MNLPGLFKLHPLPWMVGDPNGSSDAFPNIGKHYRPVSIRNARGEQVLHVGDAAKDEAVLMLARLITTIVNIGTK